MTKFINTLLLTALLLGSLYSIVPSQAAAFDLFRTSCTGAAKDSPTCTQAQSQGSNSSNRLTGTGNVIQDATDLISIVAGAAAVIVIIISAITLITSGGSTEAVTTSRRRLMTAIIGLVIIALSWTIVTYVTNNLAKT